MRKSLRESIKNSDSGTSIVRSDMVARDTLDKQNDEIIEALELVAKLAGGCGDTALEESTYAMLNQVQDEIDEGNDISESVHKRINALTLRAADALFEDNLDEAPMAASGVREFTQEMDDEARSIGKSKLSKMFWGAYKDRKSVV